MTKNTPRLTPPQRRVIDNLASGKDLCHGMKRGNPHGGLAWTRDALRAKGMIDQDRMITEKGKAAIKPEIPEQQ
jgi:hypothetical protein